MRKRLKNHFIPHEGNDYKPHFVRERSVIGLTLLVVAVFGLAFSVKNLVTKNPDILSAVITAVLVDLTNSTRTSEHLMPLAYSPILARAAQLKANDMAEKGYFAHTSPEGRSPWYWFREAQYDFLYAGENLAVNFVDSEDVVRAWMNSTGHRANILSNKFSEIGMAIATGNYNGREAIYVVQLFGEPLPKLISQPRVVSILPVNSSPKISGAIAEVKNAKVLGERSPTLDSYGGPSEMFIAVENTGTGTTEDLQSINTRGTQSSLVDRLMTSPKLLLEVFYIVLALLVTISLALFIWLSPERMHTKNAIYLILLLLLIALFIYVSSVYLYPQILIK